MSKHKESESFSVFNFVLGLLSLVSVFLLVFLFFKKQRGLEQGEVFSLPRPDSKKKVFSKKKTPKVANRIAKKKEEVKGLNDRQQKILNFLKKSGEVTVDALMNEVKGVSERTLRRDMGVLEGLGYSKKIGSTKGSKYIFTK